MSSGNLSHSTQQFLFNSLSSTDFGVFTDSVTSVKQFFIKGFGAIIPNTGDGASGKAKVVKMTSFAGTKKKELVTLSTNCPCDDCGAEYGIEIENYDQFPGVFLYYLPIRKFYGGRWNRSVVCSGSEIGVDFLRTAYLDIIQQINNDILGVGALVTATSGAALTPTTPDGATLSYAPVVKVYDINNLTTAITTITGTSTNPATLAALLVDINTALSTYGTATALNTTDIQITAASGYFIEVTSAGTNMTIDNALGIILESKTTERQFNVKYDTGTATQYVLTAGAWPRMTSTLVAREFSMKPWQHGSQPNIPIKGADYIKYTIYATMGKIADVSGPGHREEFVAKFEIYIKSDLVTGTDHWDANDPRWESIADNAGFVADTTFEELMKVVWAADVNW